MEENVCEIKKKKSEFYINIELLHQSDIYLKTAVFQ